QPLAGQDDDVSGLAATQAIEQCQRRREIRFEARAACGLKARGELGEGAFHGQCREYPQDLHCSYARRISFSTAVRRRLRLPASAVASISAPSSSQLPEKPMPTSWPPKIGFSPTAGVCSWLRIWPFQRPFSEV